MKEIHVHGGVRLFGSVKIQGSKNAALPVLAASILTEGPCLIRNCPAITDVCRMCGLLRSAGCEVSRNREGISVLSGKMPSGPIPQEAVRGMRSSMYLMGALLACGKEVTMELPGGCAIGARPIDLHLAALEKMGARFSVREGNICGAVQGRLHGARIALGFPSVGATENVILAAVKAEGETELTGAAREPEVAQLCLYLKGCGANIEGIGTDCLKIRGVSTLRGTDFTVSGDRIVAGTYLLAALGTGGRVFLEEAPVDQMEAVLGFAARLGTYLQQSDGGLYVQSPDRLLGPAEIVTLPYPGFPTDLQSVGMTVLTRAEGYSTVEETIFENRFQIVEPLRKMGAEIQFTDTAVAGIQGPVRLQGQHCAARELRGGAALVVAGLMADGETVISDCGYIDRGYENICGDFKELGARIYCE